MPQLRVAYELNHDSKALRVWIKGTATRVLNYVPNYESCKPVSPNIEISTPYINILASLWTPFNYQHLKNILALIK